MIKNSLWPGLLIVVLCVALATPASASSSLQSDATKIIVGVVAAAAAVVVLAVVLIHKSKNPRITGCVTSGASGMTITHEKDKKVYTLSGHTEAIKPGERMKLQGKKVKSKGADKTLVWEVTAVTKDLGVCQP